MLSAGYCYQKSATPKVITISGFHCIVICGLMKLEFSRQVAETRSKIKYHENPYFGSQVAPCG
jgi:NRPS condensation-like uncharacterized protein